MSVGVIKRYSVYYSYLTFFFFKLQKKVRNTHLECAVTFFFFNIIGTTRTGYFEKTGLSSQHE